MKASRMRIDSHFPSILIIDDDEAIRESLSLVFEFEGYKVHLAANGKEGLKLLETIKPSVILLDLMMPFMDGWEFAEVINADKTKNSIPIVAVSAFAEKAQGLQCQEVVQKPFELDLLVLLVKKYCQ